MTHADILDLASTYEDLERQSALNLMKSKQKPSPVCTGYCLYCEEPLDDGRRWCDADCRDDWEKENQR